MSYKFKQKVNKEDYLEFYKYYVTRNFLSPAKIGFVVMFFAVLFSGPFFGRPEMAYGGAALLILVVILYFRITGSGGKIYDGDPKAFEYTYALDEVTISFSTKDGKSSKMWSEFVKYEEKDKYLYAFTKNNKGLMFVKSDIEDEVYSFIVKKLQENTKMIKVPGFLKKK